MTEWREQKLEDLAEISSGGTPSRNNPEFWGDEVPWVTPTDITRCDTKYLFDTAESISEKGLGASSAKLLPAGALLVTSRATIGEVRIAARELATNQGFKNLVPRAGTDGLFLYYRLLSEKNQFLRYAAGSTFLEINRRDTGKVLLNVPVDPQVQQKIGRILEAADSTIEKTEALIEKYQQIKAGLMHDLFTRGIGADGKLRPPREQAPELYQETPIGWIPKEWRVDGLLSVTDSARQPILTGPFGADLGNDDFVEEGVPVLRIGNVQTGFIETEDLLFVRELKALQLSRYRISRHDLLFARQGATTGRNCLANESVEGWLINYHIIRVALDPALCSPTYIEAAFNVEVIKRQVERDKGRGTREGINTQQLTALRFPMAPIAEQYEIENRLVSIGAKIGGERLSLQKLRSTKQGLTRDLLSGNVEVANV